MSKDYELPLGDNGNFNLRGALEKFLQSFDVRVFPVFSETEVTATFLETEVWVLFTGLRNGCGFWGLEKGDICLMSYIQRKFQSSPWTYILST